jgi:hypothetical protein
MCYHVNELSNKVLLNKKEEWIKKNIYIDRSIKIPHLYFYAHYPDI